MERKKSNKINNTQRIRSETQKGKIRIKGNGKVGACDILREKT